MLVATVISAWLATSLVSALLLGRMIAVSNRHGVERARLELVELDLAA